MVKKMLVGILKKFNYVQDLEEKIIKHEQDVERLKREQDIQIIEIMKKQKELEDLNAMICYMIEVPHMLMFDGRRKFVTIDKNQFAEYTGREAYTKMNCPYNSFNIYAGK